jgi:hypothetical protein
MGSLVTIGWFVSALEIIRPGPKERISTPTATSRNFVIGLNLLVRMTTINFPGPSGEISSAQTES